MFARLLRVILYLILFVCAIWGSVLVGGPSVVKFIIYKAYGDSVTLYNLKVSPNLDILVSRIKIDDAQFNGKLINGSITSLEIGLKGLAAFNPMVEIAFGPSQLDTVGNIGRAEASFYFRERSLTSDAIVELDLIELTNNNFFKSEHIAIRGALDFRNGVLANTNFKARNVEVLTDADLSSPFFQGSLSDWYFLKDRMTVPESIELEIPKLTFFNEAIVFKDALIKSKLSNELYNVELSLKELNGERDNVKVQGILANFSTKNLEFNNIEEVKLDINSLNLPTFSFLERGDLSGLKIKLSKKNDSSYDLLLNGNLKDGDLKANDFLIAKLSNSNFKVSSNYLHGNYTPAKFKADFNIVAGDETPVYMHAAASIDASKSDLVTCLRNKCLFSNFLLTYELTAHRSNMNGVLSCRRLPCQGAEVGHEIQTTDTSAFIKDVQDTGVFNPLFLVFFYRSLMEGEKIGEGHSLKF